MRGILAFLHDDRGSQTVEFVLWLPIIASMVVIITDASILYLTQTEMTNVARDTARRLSSGQLQTENDAIVYANQQLNLYDPAYVVSVDRDPSDKMTVVIRVGVIDATVFGYFLTPILGPTMEARVVMRSDPSLALAGGSWYGNGTGNGGGNGNTIDWIHPYRTRPGYANNWPQIEHCRRELGKPVNLLLINRGKH